MKRIILIGVLLGLCLPNLALAQPRYLKGEVLLVGEEGETMPAGNVEVTLTPAGNTDITNRQGLFRVFLPKDYKPGELVTVLVNKSDWRIWHPLEGEIRIPRELKKERIRILLLPKGSKKFLTDRFIEKLIEDAAKITKLKNGEGLRARPKAFDLGPHLRSWAIKYGFTPEQVREQIDLWVEEVNEKQEDIYKLGLAAFAEKNFSKAGELLNQSAELKAEQWENARKKSKAWRVEEARLLEETVRSFRTGGDAYYHDYDFEKALESYHRALEIVDQEERPHLWASLLLDVGNAHAAIGVRTKSHRVHDNLEQASKHFTRALKVYTSEHLPQQWAATNNNLGNALCEQGTRAGGKKSLPLLAEGIGAYRKALSVNTRERFPQRWAAIENNLGNALRELGVRIGGENSRKLLTEAVEAYRRALTVYSREQQPKEWAKTQNNLGNALTEQGVRIGGEESHRLLADAERAFRQALMVYPSEQRRQEWAGTLNNLGNALRQRGIRERGEKARRLLEEAITAFRRALMVRTHKTLPQRWADTQNNLGIALIDLGVRMEGRESWRYLAEAVKAFRRALTVFTHEELPQDWAMAQNNLGNAWLEQGIHDGSPKRQRRLELAITAFQGALEVRTKKDFPSLWAQTHENLARAAYALKDWKRAASSFRNVLIYYPDYAEAYHILNMIYHDRLFEYTEAHDLTSQWLKSHPDDLAAHSNLAEALFTTGQFAKTQAKLAKLLKHPGMDSHSKVALRVLNVVTGMSLENAKGVIAELESLRILVERQPETFKLQWDFAGTKHFIVHDGRFDSSRTRQLQLIEGVEGEEKSQMLEAVRVTRESFRPISTAQIKP